MRSRMFDRSLMSLNIMPKSATPMAKNAINSGVIVLPNLFWA